VYLSSVPVDTQLHQSYYVVAHLHYVLVGGSVFTLFAGVQYWFPKITGRMLNKALGEWSFWTFFIGFNGTFLVMHTLGLEGMPRRIASYYGGFGEEGWGTVNLIITVFSFVIAFSVLLFAINLVNSWRHGDVAGDDPWGGNTLEWATTSPPPPFNFAKVPVVHSFMPMREIRAEREGKKEPEVDPNPPGVLTPVP
jgi:cytochrome c oxidase subunit I+III